MAAKGGWLERMSRAATEWTGSSLAFALAMGTIVVWGATGPIFWFSDTWQLVINTGTTIVTFLMVFLIQRAQNKDSAAIHLKLNELVASLPWASNRLISAEELTEDEVKILRTHFRKLVELAKKESDLQCSHSIEEAEADHTRKKTSRAQDRAEQERKGKKKRRRKRHPGGEQPAPAKATGTNGKAPCDAAK
ncbi:MAG: low affinity iron permease family protein [Planctomycetes bacterium]|nr:low affinity iron permease family protein [Planctomycetota bacterium]